VITEDAGNVATRRYALLISQVDGIDGMFGCGADMVNEG
jgi:hypothetical protein